MSENPLNKGRYVPLEQVKGRLTHSPGAPPAFDEHDGMISPEKWAGQPVPNRDWLAKDLIPTAEVTMITGNGGDGKSIISLQLLIAAHFGGQWLGRDVKAVLGLGCYCEDDHFELHRRVSQIVNGEGLRLEDLAGTRLLGRKGKDNILFEAQYNDMTGRFTPAFYRLKETAEKLGAQLLVLDSLYDFFAGNENSKTQVKQFVNGLAELANDITGAVVIVSHPSLAGIGAGSGTAGSTAWHNSVRSRLYLHRRAVPKWELEKNPDARGQLVLQPMKSNYGPPELGIPLMWEAGRFVSLKGTTQPVPVNNEPEIEF